MADKPPDKTTNVTYVEDAPDPTKAIQGNEKNIAVIKTQDSRFATYLVTHKPSAVSKSLLALYPILFVAFMNSAANGFDGNTFGGVSVCLPSSVCSGRLYTWLLLCGIHLLQLFGGSGFLNFAS